jgi:hypothetical protein
MANDTGLPPLPFETRILFVDVLHLGSDSRALSEITTPQSMQINFFSSCWVSHNMDMRMLASTDIVYAITFRHKAEYSLLYVNAHYRDLNLFKLI